MIVKVRGADGAEEVCTNESFVLEFDRGEPISGNTSGDGSLCETVPPSATRATLNLEALGAVLPLKFAHLDPWDFPSGIQARLNMLGYRCGEVDEDLGPMTEQAVRAFQEAKQLTVDGIAGPKTQDKLKSDFGS